ncbi:MAG: amino acid decarboxylase, partial [Lachnospiraceae bacterium]|nr:amino acid decarboxylase [Lachnospiraceae bacterium]
SPTYEGMVSDVREIADFLHQKQIPLMVDEAHGSHFGLYPTFPESALSCGADLVIHSLHKTLPSLTQTALLHVQGELIDRERVRRYLRVFQSTSPSYPLMASIDSCVCEVKKAGAYRFLHLEKLRNLLEEKTGNLTEVRILPREMIADPCKIVVFSSSKTGRWISDQLRHDYHLEPEMEGEHHVVLILTGYDTSEGIQRLVNAVQGINETAVWEKQKGEERRDGSRGFTEMTKHLPKRRILPTEAWDRKREWKELNESKGSICAEMLHVYPPGIPLLVAGEEIDAETILAMKQLLQAGANLQGIRWQEGRVYVPVVKNKPLPNLCLS